MPSFIADERVETELLPPQLKILRIEAKSMELSNAVCWARCA